MLFYLLHCGSLDPFCAFFCFAWYSGVLTSENHTIMTPLKAGFQLSWTSETRWKKNWMQKEDELPLPVYRGVSDSLKEFLQQLHLENHHIP